MNKKSRVLRGALFAVWCVSLGQWPSIGSAQSAPDANDTELESVVVTALRRSEDAQTVPIAIQSFSADELEKRRVEQPLDLQGLVAGLTIVNTFSDATPIFSIRGVSADDIYPNSSSPVGVYYDEVYAASPLMLVHPVFDVERVEVLKGPQGTLYGRNTPGGAINFISNKPTRESEGYVSLGLGRWETVDLDAAIGGPISDRVSYRLAGTVTDQGEGYQKDILTGREFGKLERGGVRGQLQFDASDSVDIFLNAHYAYDKSIVGSPYSSFTYTGDPADVTVGDLDLENDADAFGGSVKVSMDFGGTTLTSITSYDDAQRKGADNYDGLPDTVLDFYSDFDGSQFGQELRLASNEDEGRKIDWIIGATYGDDEISAIILQDLTDVFYPAGGDLAVLAADYTQKTRSAGAFAHVVTHLSDRVDLTTGVRYSRDRRSFDGVTRDVTGGFTFTTPGGITASRNESRTTSDFSYRVGIDVQWTPTVMTYASVATGYKLGTFYGNAASTQEAWGFTQPEDVITGEIGFKSQFADGALRLNGAVFYTDYTDRQTLVAVQTQFAVTSALANIPKAESTGAELELVYKVAGLTLQATGAYVDSQVKETVEDVRGLLVLTPIPVGIALPQTPEIAYNFLARYEWGMGDLRASVQADYNRMDEAYSALGDPNALYGPLPSVGASASLSSPSGWSVELWGRNLSDKREHTYGFTSIFGDQQFYTQKPRSYGVVVGYRF